MDDHGQSGYYDRMTSSKPTKLVSKRKRVTLDEWLTKTGHSSYWLAKQLEIDPAHIQRIRHRKVDPSLTLANRITRLTFGEVTADKLEKLP